jgi:hypothetical protein
VPSRALCSQSTSKAPAGCSGPCGTRHLLQPPAPRPSPGAQAQSPRPAFPPAHLLTSPRPAPPHPARPAAAQHQPAAVLPALPHHHRRPQAAEHHGRVRQGHLLLLRGHRLQRGHRGGCQHLLRAAGAAPAQGGHLLGLLPVRAAGPGGGKGRFQAAAPLQRISKATPLRAPPRHALLDCPRVWEGVGGGWVGGCQQRSRLRPRT